jgi:ATP-binding cassette subfamily F protein 3
MLLSASQLKLFYGEVEIFTDVSVEVGEHARIGLVGPNGSGKTSLLRVLTGGLEPDAGSISMNSGLRVAYVSQMPEHDAPGTLRDEVQSAFQKLFDLEDELANSALAIQQGDGAARRRAETRYAELLEEYEDLGGYDYQNGMDRVVEGVGMTLDTLDTPAAAASGGERTRAALARALLTDPDLLVLDEPTNYLDFDGLTWLEDFLSGFKYAVVVVSHDRYFLDRVCSEIWEMERGILQRFPGNYSQYRELKRAQIERQQKEFERQQEHIAKEEFFIQRYKAGQRSREARGRETRLARLERIEAPQGEKTISIGTASASRTGHVALSLRGLSVGFTEGEARTTLLTMPDIDVESGSRTAIVGANGIGKTTLIRTILGEQTPLSGTVRLGHNVQTGYLNQGTWNLPDDKNVLEAFLEIRNLPIGEARDYLARFLFRNDDVFKHVSMLSGGERTRLSLARLLITYPNVLILDEPTTHLDIASREALEDTLESFDGTLLFVSHDRHFIGMMAERIWAIEEGTVRPFAGGFAEWMRANRPPEPEPVSRRARARHRRRERESRKQERKTKSSVQSQAVDYETLIHELESKVSNIEKQLETASERRDTDAITRLGQEYAETQQDIEDAWEKWTLASG